MGSTFSGFSGARFLAMIALMPTNVTLVRREYRALPGAGEPVGDATISSLIEMASVEIERLGPRQARPYRAFIERWRQHIAGVRRSASAARKVRASNKGGGRPAGAVSDKPRCPCGAHTLRRAQARAYDCCKAAGLRIL